MSSVKRLSYYVWFCSTLSTALRVHRAPFACCFLFCFFFLLFSFIFFSVLYDSKMEYWANMSGAIVNCSTSLYVIDFNAYIMNMSRMMNVIDTIQQCQLNEPIPILLTILSSLIERIYWIAIHLLTIGMYFICDVYTCIQCIYIDISQCSSLVLL